MKNLIFIVAYRAERHIASVFARIPYDYLPEGTELLLIDANPLGISEPAKQLPRLTMKLHGVP
jgi:hypothetical protein